MKSVTPLSINCSSVGGICEQIKCTMCTIWMWFHWNWWTGLVLCPIQLRAQRLMRRIRVFLCKSWSLSWSQSSVTCLVKDRKGTGRGTICLEQIACAYSIPYDLIVCSQGRCCIILTVQCTTHSYNIPPPKATDNSAFPSPIYKSRDNIFILHWLSTSIEVLAYYYRHSDLAWDHGRREKLQKW